MFYFLKLILFVVPCVLEFIKFYLFPDFKGVNSLC
jgi:hypothetical protein